VDESNFNLSLPESHSVTSHLCDANRSKDRIEVAGQADDQLLEKLKECESSIQAVQNEADAGGIRSDYVNASDGWVMLFGSLCCHQPALMNKHD
jgi:hypothetical protein